jgi:DnaJ-class molecular chaperone
MINYYELLEIDNKATEDEIYQAYNHKISQFNHLPFHTTQMIKEIKLLKEAIYVLGDETKREKYNNKLQRNKKYMEEGRHIDNTQICNRLFNTFG